MAKGSKKRASRYSGNVPAPQRVRKKASAVERTALLTHDTKEKRGDLKLQLHLRRTQRSIDHLRQRLENWDPVEEEEKRKQQEASEAEEGEPRKKRPKWNSPETWKLRGAARPAWMVYDFDTRYVDPHIQAHEKAKEKRGRLVNLLSTASSCDLTTMEVGRDFLTLLMQHGHLNQEAKKYSTARESFLECLELDKGSATTAAESLISMYMELQKYESALKLGLERPDDTGVVLRYSTALAAHILQKPDASQSMEKAVRCNVFCAQYLRNVEVFKSVVECTDEIEEVESDLEEALEYCDQHADRWIETGAAKCLVEAMGRMNDVPDWEAALASMTSQPEVAENTEMFASMFKTAMELVTGTDEKKSSR